MPKTEDFEDIVDEVKSGSIHVEREIPEYELPKKGEHKGKVIEVEQKHISSKYGESDCIVLKIEIDQTYEKEHDGKKEQVPFVVGTNLLNIGSGCSPKSNIGKLFHELTGADMKAVLVESEVKERGGKRYALENVNCNGFIGMEATVIVKHEEVEDKGTFSRILSDDFMCEEEQRISNLKIAKKGGEKPKAKKG